MGQPGTRSLAATSPFHEIDAREHAGMLVLAHGCEEAKESARCGTRKTCFQSSLGRLDTSRENRSREEGWKSTLGQAHEGGEE